VDVSLRVLSEAKNEEASFNFQLLTYYKDSFGLLYTFTERGKTMDGRFTN
jgi:hypothetical protein